MASAVVADSQGIQRDHSFVPINEDVQNTEPKENIGDPLSLKESAHQLTQSTLEAAAKRLALIEKTAESGEIFVSDDKTQSSNALQGASVDHPEPVEDPLEKATKFLEKHQLLMLFQTLTSDIVLKRPSNPLDFMIEEIEKIQEMDRHRKGVFLKVNKQTASVTNNEEGDLNKMNVS